MRNHHKKGGDVPMSKGIFVTGTGTDVGKTYVTALLAKKCESMVTM